MSISREHAGLAKEATAAIICWYRKPTLMDPEVQTDVPYNNRLILQSLGTASIQATLRAALEGTNVYCTGETLQFTQLLWEVAPTPQTATQLHRWVAVAGKHRAHKRYNPDFLTVRQGLIKGQRELAQGMVHAVKGIGQDPEQVLPHLPALFVEPDQHTRSTGIWLPDMTHPLPGTEPYSYGDFHPIPRPRE